MPLKVLAVERREEIMKKVDSALQYHLDEFKVDPKFQDVLFD